MSFRWPRSSSPAGLTAAMLLASPLSLAAESPAVTASLEGADVATNHLFNALLYLPGGFVAAVLMLEFFAQWKRNREVEPAVLFLLFGAAGAAVGSAVLAYAVSPVGRGTGELQGYAMWMGVVAAAISAAFYLKRQARNRRLFSLKPLPELSGKIALPRTSGERGLIIGYRIAVVCAFLLTLVGVSEMPLSQARTRSLADSVRSVRDTWGQPAPAVASTAPVSPDQSVPAAPLPSEPVAPPVPSLAHLLGSEPANPGSPATASTGAAPGVPGSPTTAPEAAPSSATTPPETASTAPPEPPPATTPPEAPAMAATPQTPPSPAPAPMQPTAPAPAAAGTSKLPANFFATRIKPVLDSKCVDCHGPGKQKGDLRLDTVAAIRHGAGHPVVVGGDLELSSLYQRLISPDADDLMPPRDKGGPLPPNVIALFKSWIQAGADFGDGAATAGRSTSPAQPGGKLEEEKSRSLPAPSPDVIARLADGGAVIRPMSANGALLDVNLTHFEAGPVNLADLTPIAKNILALDLTRTRVKDDDLAHLAGMSSLVRLDLKRNAITDAGLVHLKGLVELESLNLFDTQVSDAGLSHLTGLKRLQKIFLFNTKATAAGADQLRAAIPGIVVNLGE